MQKAIPGWVLKSGIPSAFIGSGIVLWFTHSLGWAVGAYVISGAIGVSLKAWWLLRKHDKMHANSNEVVGTSR